MRNFTNKLWNMGRFIEMKRISEKESVEIDINKLLEKAKHKKDKEMIEKTKKIITTTTKLIEKYDFNHAAQKLYDFTWHEFADKYIEDVKQRIDENSEVILNSLFLILLKLLHPFIPFITEEIRKRLFKESEYLIISDWPKV